MTWILPDAKVIPAGGVIRVVGRYDRRAYDRAYYHTKRKGRHRQTYTPEQLARRRELRRQGYLRNLERERAAARVRYWQNRERYAAASRERQRALRAFGG